MNARQSWSHGHIQTSNTHTNAYNVGRHVGKSDVSHIYYIYITQTHERKANERKTVIEFPRISISSLTFGFGRPHSVDTNHTPALCVCMSCKFVRICLILFSFSTIPSGFFFSSLRLLLLIWWIIDCELWFLLLLSPR